MHTILKLTKNQIKNWHIRMLYHPVGLIFLQFKVSAYILFTLYYPDNPISASSVTLLWQT
jgi:hypothetical protein